MLTVATPLIRQGYIGHGNGLVYLVAVVLTSPLSAILLLITDRLFAFNAFHMTGWPYLLTLSELGVGALFNAGVIYLLITFVQCSRRKG